MGAHPFQGLDPIDDVQRGFDEFGDVDQCVRDVRTPDEIFSGREKRPNPGGS